MHDSPLFYSCRLDPDRPNFTTIWINSPRNGVGLYHPVRRSPGAGAGSIIYVEIFPAKNGNIGRHTG
ncbi:hypothetical protein DPMN_014343 [Dreissena polymorpha]|uniref:Uncharacterized protein n=1 Tax=Dreissena polymorpha TaxID=45954 RepID=A0A9D4N5U5_DREPO|nr:hypothetical protein DPMN_014343 [Dreissena polymorpha]